MSKVAVVTGGGGGIGRAVSIALSKAGWSCVVIGRTQASLDETVGSLAGKGIGIACDVSDPKQVDAAFAEAAKVYPGYAKYRERASHRTIEVYVLSPT